ncbi:MAG TPA: FRG domain-containing protein, partial [Sedimentisphaerales bacterium]|nr:FRG domain-containing protein [Sedimentisphaerales bacterium]
EKFDDVITIMTDRGGLLEDRFFFRGQSDKSWPLLPSFTRILNQANGCGLLLAPFEAVVVKKFMAMARQHIPGHMIPADEDLVGWWQLMQHYKAPTRLLDWTISPYVAAYFAVTENLDKDGVIWVVNYSCLQKAVDAELKKNNCSNTETDTWYVMNPLLQAANFIRAANTNHKNQRAVAQQAELTFTVNVFFDHGMTIQSLLDDLTEREQVETGKTIPTGFNYKSATQVDSKSLSGLKYFKIIIPKERKKDYLARLHIANISASSLFPGLDGVGLAIKEEIDWQIHVAIKSFTSGKC